MRTVPLVYRLLLLGLLPCIAAAIYIRSRDYDPGLIDFKSLQPLAATTNLSPSVPMVDGKKTLSTIASEPGGFRQSARARNYTKENLYEHINGHAEYFINAGFEGLVVTEYLKADSTASEADMQVEIFDMGRPIQAFGVLMDESGEQAPPASVGDMGFSVSGGLNFIKGRYYVKVSGLKGKPPIVKFARAFSETLPAETGSFKIFSRFPDIGKVARTRFVKEGYRGLDFLHNVVEREYLQGTRRVSVALIEGEGLPGFIDYFKKSGLPYEKIERDRHEAYSVSDKYEGRWFLIPAKGHIFCVFGAEDNQILEQFWKKKG